MLLQAGPLCADRFGERRREISCGSGNAGEKEFADYEKKVQKQKIQDEEIRTLEKRVEQAKVGGKEGPATSKDDDAFWKAQEALARAQANRERTRTELEQMEKQEREDGR